MKTQAAYEKYQIMPTLTDHMYLVGAVAKIYIDQIQEDDFPAREIISACLLHDIGNIVKFDLDNVPEGLDIPDLDYWKKVQKETRDMYGADEHDITYQISQRIGVSDLTLNAISNCGTAKAGAVLAAKNIPAMFVTFCDYHVTPTKIVSPEERLQDILHRYRNHVKLPGYQRDGKNVLALANYLQDRYSLKTDKISDSLVRQTAEELRDWELI